MEKGTDEVRAGVGSLLDLAEIHHSIWPPPSEFVRIGDAAIRRSAITSVALARDGEGAVVGVHVCTVAEEFKFRRGECRPATFEDALAFAEKALAAATKGA